MSRFDIACAQPGCPGVESYTKDDQYTSTPHTDQCRDAFAHAVGRMRRTAFRSAVPTFFTESDELPFQPFPDPNVNRCACGAELHANHVCAVPVTRTEPYVDPRPCLHCQAADVDPHFTDHQHQYSIYDGHRHAFCLENGRWVGVRVGGCGG